MRKKKRINVNLIMSMTSSETCNIIEDFKMYFTTVSCTKRNKVSSQIIFSDIAEKSLLIYSQILYLIVYLLLNIVTWHLWATGIPWDYNKSSNVFLLSEWSFNMEAWFTQTFEFIWFKYSAVWEGTMPNTVLIGNFQMD